MIHKHVVLGITLLTEARSIIVILPDVTVVGVMDVLLDSLKHGNRCNSPDTLGLMDLLNQLPCKPRFQNLANMPTINIDYTRRVVLIQGATERAGKYSFEKYVTAHENGDYYQGPR